MRSSIIGMLAETSIHPGSGQDTGFVDLPVAREAATDFPVIPGSSMKGAILDRARQEKVADSDRNRIFGEQEMAGKLLVGDARLLLLPVRSLQGSYKWVTSPQLIQRFCRDSSRMNGVAPGASKLPTIKSGTYMGANHGSLFLEERQFEFADAVSTDLHKELEPLMLSSAENLATRLVILSDDDFSWFARYGLAINARNVLDEVKKTSKNLWYEETISPDSLFYCLLSERDSSSEGCLDLVLDMFNKRPYLQAGGNETVGQGWFGIRPIISQKEAV